MKNPAVSVIIPVYNAENYLQECLDSVLAQTEKDIEIICVDDGSTDRSGSILDDYAKRDSRIHIISKENGGQSSARNVGFAAAKGEYIYYLDSDDLIEPELISACKEASDYEQLDVLFFDAKTIFENQEIRNSNRKYENYYIRNGVYDYVTSGQKLFCSMVNNLDYRVSVCMQFARRSFLAEANLRFIEDIIYEDEPYTMYLMLLANRAMHIGKQYFTRRVRAGSTMTSETSIHQVYSRFCNLKHIQDIMEQLDPEPEVYHSVLSILSGLQLSLIKKYNKASEEDKMGFLKKLSKRETTWFLLLVELFTNEQQKRNKVSSELKEVSRLLEEKEAELRSSQVKYNEIASLKQHVKYYLKNRVGAKKPAGN